MCQDIVKPVEFKKNQIVVFKHIAADKLSIQFKN